MTTLRWPATRGNAGGNVRVLEEANAAWALSGHSRSSGEGANEPSAVAT